MLPTILAVLSTVSPILRIDTRLNKFSQASVVVLTAVAFLTNQPIITAIAALFLTISAIAPLVSPFRLIYRGLLVPTLLV